MHLKVGFVSMAVVAATVSASSFQVMNPLTARGTCDSVCNLITAADTQCKAETNYDKCFCTSTNLMNLDNCYACLVLDVEANAKANSILTGDSTAVGADSLKADGERAHKQMLDGCKSSGFALDASSSSGGSTVTSSNTTASGTTAGSQTPNSNNAGLKINEHGSGVTLQVLIVAALIWSLL